MNKLVSIRKGYKELTDKTFAIWVRMSVMEQKYLIKLDVVAQRLGLSMRQLRDRTKELQEKGYIKVERGGNEAATAHIVMLKRLAPRELFPVEEEAIIAKKIKKEFKNVQKGTKHTKSNDDSTFDSIGDVFCNERGDKIIVKGIKKVTFNAGRMIFDLKTDFPKTLSSRIKPSLPDASLSIKDPIKYVESTDNIEPGGDLDKLRKCSFSKKDKKRLTKNIGVVKSRSVGTRRPFVSHNSAKTTSLNPLTPKPLIPNPLKVNKLTPKIIDHEFTSTNFNLKSKSISNSISFNTNSKKENPKKKLEDQRKKLRDQKKKLEDQKRKIEDQKKRIQKTKQKTSSSSSKIDLSKYTKENRKKPVKALQTPSSGFCWLRIVSPTPRFNFDLEGDLRTEVTEILEGDKRDPDRRLLLDTMTKEYVDIYTRYRRMVQECEGKRRSYVTIDSEIKKASKAAEVCFLKNVTPYQVIEYWHNHISKFLGPAVKCPTLAFLASAINVDTVACEGPSSKSSFRSRLTQNLSEEEILKRQLEEAGFDLSDVTEGELGMLPYVAAHYRREANYKYSHRKSVIPQCAKWMAENL